MSKGKGIVDAAMAKRALLDAVTEEDLALATRTIIQNATLPASEEAQKAQLEWIKLLLLYVIGRPRTAPSMPRTISLGSLGSTAECLEALDKLEQFVAMGTITPDDAEDRHKRIALALNAHRSMAGEKALDMLEEYNLAPHYGDASDETVEEKLASFQAFLEEREAEARELMGEAPVDAPEEVEAPEG